VKIRWFVTIVVVLLIAAISRSASGNHDALPRSIQGGTELFKFVALSKSRRMNNLRAEASPASVMFRRLIGWWWFLGHTRQPTEGCVENAHAYKEYTVDMQATGQSGVLNCGMGTAAGRWPIMSIMMSVCTNREIPSVGLSSSMMPPPGRRWLTSSSRWITHAKGMAIRWSSL